MYKYLLCFLFVPSLCCMEKEASMFMHFTVVNATDYQVRVECKEIYNQQENKISELTTLLKYTGDHIGFKASINEDKQRIILLMRFN